MPGVDVRYGTDYVYGYGMPGQTVILTLRDASGVKGTASVQVGSNGSFSTRALFLCLFCHQGISPELFTCRCTGG